jgi:pectinesterase inhibitor-like protein
VIRKAADSTSATSLYFLNLQFKKGVDPAFQQVVRLCSATYANASKALDESSKALRILQYNLARLEVNAAKLYNKDCGDAFRGTPGLKYPTMLLGREALVDNLCHIVSGILNRFF